MIEDKKHIEIYNSDKGQNINEAIKYLISLNLSIDEFQKCLKEIDMHGVWVGFRDKRFQDNDGCRCWDCKNLYLWHFAFRMCSVFPGRFIPTTKEYEEDEIKNCKSYDEIPIEEYKDEQKRL